MGTRDPKSPFWGFRGSNFTLSNDVTTLDRIIESTLHLHPSPPINTWLSKHSQPAKVIQHSKLNQFSATFQMFLQVRLPNFWFSVRLKPNAAFWSKQKSHPSGRPFSELKLRWISAPFSRNTRFHRAIAYPIFQQSWAEPTQPCRIPSRQTDCRIFQLKIYPLAVFQLQPWIAAKYSNLPK